MPAIEIRGLTKAYRAGARALDAVDLEVGEGELLALVGPSGSGKTTLLRLLSGLEEPTAGTIRLSGKDLAGVPPHQRNVSLVFQSLALYSHLTVAGNLSFGLERGEATERVGTVAELLDIGPLLDRYPAELSGGEQQRVALGRALAQRPAALLLDEPLSSLDAPERRTLRRRLKRLQRDIGLPMIYVTHNQEEALALGDRVAVLASGRLQQVAAPDEIYYQPANAFVGNFFGPQGMNLLEGALESTGQGAAFQADDWKIDLKEYAPPGIRGQVACGFRADELRPGHGDLRGRVTAVERLGDAIYVQVEVPSRAEPQFVAARQMNIEMTPPSPGTLVPLSLDVSRLLWFDLKNGRRL